MSPAGWHQLSVLVPRPLVAALGRELVALGATGVQEDHPPGRAPRLRQPWDRGPGPRPSRRVLVRAWFAVLPEAERLREILAGRALAEATWEHLPDQDWAETWKEHFQPVRVSERLVVAAPWHEVPGALVIEPGNAFGTGEHPSTRACLRFVDRLARPGATLLDVGCGSGVLALAGAKLGMRAEGIDTDPDAVRAAEAAAAANGLTARFSTTRLAQVRGRFDLVVANLYAEVLAELAADLLRLAGGPIGCAGILADRAGLVKAALAGRPLWEEEVEGDWVALLFGGP